MRTDPPALEHRLAEFRRRCAQAGLAVTHQRLAVFRALAVDPAHPSAEEIHRRVKEELPTLSLGTVYRTLELLRREGLVDRVPGFEEQARFDANSDDHHHLVCVRCRRVVDFQDDSVRVLGVLPANLHGFRVLRHAVQVHGVCPECEGASEPG